MLEGRARGVRWRLPLRLRRPKTTSFPRISYMFGDSPSRAASAGGVQFFRGEYRECVGAAGFLSKRVWWSVGFQAGVLLPDVYTFRIEHFVGGGNDPLGDHSEGEWDMRLSVSNAVPDAGSSALLLGVGLVGLLAFGGRMVEVSSILRAGL